MADVRDLQSTTRTADIATREFARAYATTSRVPNVKMPLEPVVNLLALGGVVYVATVANVYRVEGDELVRLHWPRGPRRRRKEG